MKNTLLIITLFFIAFSFAQEQETKNEYKKRVLENAEIDFISSFYSQDGDNASITGGIGTEELTDIATNITVAIPLNDDDIFTLDATISAYTSASSSNLDPFNSGASSGEDDDDDDDDRSFNSRRAGGVTGSPWVESSGASKSDIWASGVLGYSHSSDDRNSIWSSNLSFAAEYDYISIGFGGGYTKLFNEKNTEVSIKANVYLDTWNPKYPTELDSYLEANQNLNNGFFTDVDILNQDGEVIDKNGSEVWSAFKNTFIDNKSRNTYSASLSFS
jgi:hypothetical protein